MAFGIHINVVAFSRIGLGANTVKTCRYDHRLQQVGVGSTIRKPQLKPAGAGHTHHMGAVVAGPCHGIWRPCGPRHGARCIDPLIAVDRRIGNRSQSAGVFHDAAQKMLALFGKANLTGWAFAFVGCKDIGCGGFSGGIPDRDMRMAAIAGQPFDRLGHKGGAQPVLFGH